MSPTVLPPNVDFVISMQFLAILPKFPPSPNQPHLGNPCTIAPLIVYSNAISSIAPLIVQHL